MNISSGIKESAIQDVVRAFSRGTDDVIGEIKQEYGLVTGNFKNMCAWDIRFERLKRAALQNDLEFLTKRRANWTYISILNTHTRILYVFTKEKNIDAVIKKFGSNKIHYFHAFVSINGDDNDLVKQQQELFPLFPDEYEEKRLREVQKILGEDYSRINSVVFVVAREEEKRIIGVEARLFNRYFELVDIENWSQYISNVQYSDIINNVVEPIEENENIKLIPKIKQSVKDRKEHFNKELPKYKQKIEDSKEEHSR